jgi:hypothetical protein
MRPEQASNGLFPWKLDDDDDDDDYDDLCSWMFRELFSNLFVILFYFNQMYPSVTLLSCIILLINLGYILFTEFYICFTHFDKRVSCSECHTSVSLLLIHQYFAGSTAFYIPVILL